MLLANGHSALYAVQLVLDARGGDAAALAYICAARRMNAALRSLAA
jgi:hypothetical protein